VHRCPAVPSGIHRQDEDIDGLATARTALWKHVVELREPRFVVVQDLDDPLDATLSHARNGASERDASNSYGAF
jgi:hypothetical protein